MQVQQTFRYVAENLGSCLKACGADMDLKFSDAGFLLLLFVGFTGV